MVLITRKNSWWSWWGGWITDGDKWDITVSAGGTVWELDNNVVDTAQIATHAVVNNNLAQMNSYTVKGRLAGNGTPQDVAMADLPISTATQTALNWKSNVWHWHNLSDITIDTNLEMGSFSTNTTTSSYNTALSWVISYFDLDHDTDDAVFNTMSVVLFPRSSWLTLHGVVPIPTMLWDWWTHLFLYNDLESGRSVTISNQAWGSTYYFNNPSGTDIILKPWEGIHYQYDIEKRWICNDQISWGGDVVAAWVSSEIQYNNSGAFAAAARSKIDPSSWVICMTGWADPTAPAAWDLLLYSKSIAGKVVPKVKWPSGLDYPLQASFRQNNICMWYSTAATSWVWEGTTGAWSWTYTTVLPSTTTVYTTIKRGAWANVVTTLNQVLGQSGTQSMFFLGNQPNMWGFLFVARAWLDVWTNGGRMFAWLSPSAPIASNPTLYQNTIWFIIEDGDAGAISFMTRQTGTITKVATWLTAVTNKWYDFYLFAAPNSATISWRIVDINTWAEASWVQTTNTPTINTMLRPHVLASNAALTTVASVRIGINRIYIETDY